MEIYHNDSSIVLIPQLYIVGKLTPTYERRKFIRQTFGWIQGRYALL